MHQFSDFQENTSISYDHNLIRQIEIIRRNVDLLTENVEFDGSINSYIVN